jgi:hypothetical protein
MIPAPMTAILSIEFMKKIYYITAWN